MSTCKISVREEVWILYGTHYLSSLLARVCANTLLSKVRAMQTRLCMDTYYGYLLWMLTSEREAVLIMLIAMA